MRTIKRRVFVGDFETTVYDNQEYTEVWASACVELYTENVNIFHSIQEQFDYFVSLKENILCYYHNLKFDGAFWLSYLLQVLKYTQALNEDGSLIQAKDMPNNTLTYNISELGQWYSITVRVNNKFIEFRDSLKLLPFSVKKIGKSFGTKHKKLEIEYKGFRYAGCTITDEEKEYIANDVLVVKEALEIMFNEGHNKLTIGSCCLSEFRKLTGKEEYEYNFPDVYEIPIDENLYGSSNAGEYIKGSYRGGWCYLVKGKENKIYKKGTTADVNSLYPSMMSSESGNYYPVGKPIFWKGNYIPEEALSHNRYFFIRLQTRFYIKEGYLPFIQIKSSYMYHGREMLETSDIKKDGKYYRYYTNLDKELVPARPILTMTMTDYYLLLEHYNLEDFEILDGCYFDSMIGLFDTYIEKYKKIKLESEGAIRELAKLFLNNLYGKMASSPNSDYKVAYIKEDGSIGFYTVVANDKKAGYIPIGSAITSYARNFTIRVAQKNYHGKGRGFIYADTDSIHCNLYPHELKGIEVHDKNFCCWKLESCWDEGIFVRAKTYIEHITHENLKEIDRPYYNVKCAGMPDRCKNLFVRSMLQDWEEDREKYNEEEIEFLEEQRTLKDFKIGLVVPSKLRPKRILGGIVLEETTYRMHNMK